uniref:Uncharacterized protein n=1 Tax=Rhizophora mucronata TaxID=61149 RepID=A0A2P2P3B8_RHIMU
MNISGSSQWFHCKFENSTL